MLSGSSARATTCPWSGHSSQKLVAREPRTDPRSNPSLPQLAKSFIDQHAFEVGDGQDPKLRLEGVLREVEATGTYRQTFSELEWAGRAAWRNSTRCVGRLYWKSLRVVDARDATTPALQEEAIRNHLSLATNGGAIRPVMTVFPPERPGAPGPRIRNHQLIQYAWWEDLAIGDRANARLTRFLLRKGWKPPVDRCAFDVLPVWIENPGGSGVLIEWKREEVLRVDIRHPRHPALARLDWSWHAVPALSDFRLEAGGIIYPTALFNGWYMGTEIGARNLVDPDRYDGLVALGRELGLDLSREDSLWRDEALVILNQAVLESFSQAGVTMVDHHTATADFMKFCTREKRAGREVHADWSWMIPPMSPAATPVWNADWPTEDLDPRLVQNPAGETH